MSEIFWRRALNIETNNLVLTSTIFLDFIRIKNNVKRCNTL